LILSFRTDALKCVVWGGRALVVGFAGGEIEKVRWFYEYPNSPTLAPTRPGSTALPQLPLNLVLLKNVSVIGIYWGSYLSATRHLSPFSLGSP
jgi:NADPH:quinone reductase